MAYSNDLEKKILNKNFGKLKDWIDPDPLIESDADEKIFNFRDKRDIKEQKTTTEKNELIINKVRSKGEIGYRNFKELLDRSQQRKLVEFLTLTENGKETNQQEKELYDMAEERLKLSPNYFQIRCVLKDDLITSYKRRYSKIQLSPLIKEKDTPLATFYIRPEMNGKRPGTDEMHQIKTLTDIFKLRNKVYKEVYLTADAGLGKTTFSKYLAISWCQAHCPEGKDKTTFEKDDIDCMSKFEFVFLVLLRDSNNLCSIDDLIFELIVSTLSHSEKFDKCFLQEILSRENCLVILDGLDEWSHPENPGKPCERKPRSIPHRNDRKRCTVLTTTRPWKLGVLKLSSNEFGKRVELTKLSKVSVVTLTKRTLQRLKSLPCEDSLNKEVEKFNEEIKASDNEDLASVPLLLMYIICLWCDGAEIGSSKCDLYIKIVELLLSRTAKKHREIQSSREPLDGILQRFTGYDFCTKYFLFLKALGNLACHTLLSDNREHTLVFDGSLARRYLKEEDMKLSLLSGLLTEGTTKTLTNQFSTVSFSHKTVQEFLAAIFVSSKSDGQNIVLEKCKSVQSILDVSTICQFISGINATMMCDISEGFMSVINEDERTLEYRTRTGWENIYVNTLYHIQNMLMSCLKEIPHERENTHLYLQDLFISGHSEQDLKCLPKLNINNIKSLYINISSTSMSLRKIIKLSSFTDLNHLLKLHYEGDRRKEAEINRLLSPCLQTLSLSLDKLSNYEGILSEKLEQIQNLQHLYIYDFTFSHEILETFFDFISSKSRLKRVRMYRLYCKEHVLDCERRKLDLSKNNHLTTVELDRFPSLELNIAIPSLIHVRLSWLNLGESTILLSSDMLNIKHVELEFIEMSADSLLNNVKILEKISHLVTIVMLRCHEEPETESFRNYIRSSENFDVTADYYYYKEHGRWRFEFNTRKPRTV